MRLLNVTQSYYPFLDQGGPTVKVRALARGMAASGHEVTVLTADLGFDPGKTKNCKCGIEPLGIRSERRWRGSHLSSDTRPISSAHMESGGCRVLPGALLPLYDIVHIYGLYDLIGPRVASACRRIARPYVVEPMGMFQPIVRNILLKRLYHAVLGGAMLGGAARLIATAEQERQELLAGGIPDSKIVVRRNGIDVPGNLPPRAGSVTNGIYPQMLNLYFSWDVWYQRKVRI